MKLLLFERKQLNDVFYVQWTPMEGANKSPNAKKRLCK